MLIRVLDARQIGGTLHCSANKGLTDWAVLTETLGWGWIYTTDWLKHTDHRVTRYITTETPASAAARARTTPHVELQHELISLYTSVVTSIDSFSLFQVFYHDSGSKWWTRWNLVACRRHVKRLLQNKSRTYAQPSIFSNLPTALRECNEGEKVRQLLNPDWLLP